MRALMVFHYTAMIGGPALLFLVALAGLLGHQTLFRLLLGLQAALLLAFSLLAAREELRERGMRRAAGG